MAKRKPRSHHLDDLSALCDFASETKQEAIWAFIDAEFAFSDAFAKMHKLYVRVQAIKNSARKPSAKLLAAQDAAQAAFLAAGDVQDDALDDLIAAEFTSRAANKTYDRHVCPDCKAKDTPLPTPPVEIVHEAGHA